MAGFQHRGSSDSFRGANNLFLGITSFLRNEQLPVSTVTVHKDVSKAGTSVPTHATQRAGLCPGGNTYTSIEEQPLCFVIFFVIEVSKSAEGKSHLR